MDCFVYQEKNCLFFSSHFHKQMLPNLYLYLITTIKFRKYLIELLDGSKIKINFTSKAGTYTLLGHHYPYLYHRDIFTTSSSTSLLVIYIMCSVVF